jgi:hypothetical protein
VRAVNGSETDALRVVAGRYVLTTELGRGAAGVVWRGQDLLLGRDVAVKELLLPLDTGDGERERVRRRVLREARTAGRLNHPGVVAVHDVVPDGDSAFIVMEVVEAPTLAALVAERGPLPPAEVMSVAVQALSALEAAHAAGVVHRDVKPANLMVDADGRVKLADFGIAQAADDPNRTVRGAVIGSPAYMAPERVRGWDATPASDLWSLGATLACAVEGVAPFARTSTASTLFAITTEVPRLTRATGALAALINGLLTPEAHLRLTAEGARELLRGVAAEQDADRPETARRRRPRRPVAGLLVALGVLGGLAGGVLAGRTVLAPDPLLLAVSPVSTGEPTVLTFGRGGQVPAFELGGDGCGVERLTEGDPVLRSENVSCAEPHRIESYAVQAPFGDLGRGAEYPGDEWLRDYGAAHCAQQFESPRVRRSEGGPDLAFGALVPSRTEWTFTDDDGHGSQVVVCVLWRADEGDLTTAFAAG